MWLLLIILILIIPPKAMALESDWRIQCTSDSRCKNIGQVDAIFSESNIVPGQAFTRTLTIDNRQKLHTCQLYLRLQNSSDISDRGLDPVLLVTAVTSGSTFISEIPLATLETEAMPRYVGSLNPLTEKDYNITILFDPTAGNEYQAQSSVFDISATVSCVTDDELPVAFEEHVDLPIYTPQEEFVLDQGCVAKAPTKTPELKLDNFSEQRGTVTFTWKNIANADEYVLEFGTESGSSVFKHRGIQKSPYAVSGLVFPGEYYFRVTPFNDCAKGPESNEVIVRSIEGSVAPETLEQEQNRSKILGAQEKIVEDDQVSEFRIEKKPGWGITVAGLILFLVFFLFRLWHKFRRKNQ